MKIKKDHQEEIMYIWEWKTDWLFRDSDTTLWAAAMFSLLEREVQSSTAFDPLKATMKLSTIVKLNGKLCQAYQRTEKKSSNEDATRLIKIWLMLCLEASKEKIFQKIYMSKVEEL